MLNEMSKEVFCEKNRIDADMWIRADIDWVVLKEIAADHEAQSANLENSAELFAKVIQKFSDVHSVRWRVKDAEHLIAKIIRKRADKNPKYSDISIDNYFEIVTDLVGIRALHLFKEGCFEIDAALKKEWNPIEDPVAYIREGDSKTFKTRFEANGFIVKDHPAGYRSIHYVIASTPIKRKIISEIQVRTIFEEGWSEIDHKIRYPNFSENELVAYFLEIFNRMAGSADDMGGFVLGLVDTLSHLAEEISVEKREKESVFKKMEQALAQLDSLKLRDKASKSSIEILNDEIAKLKAAGFADIAPSLASAKRPADLGFGSHLASLANAAELANRSVHTDFFAKPRSVSKAFIDYQDNLVKSMRSQPSLAQSILKKSDSEK